MFANKREYGLSIHVSNGTRRIRSPTTHGIDLIITRTNTLEIVGQIRPCCPLELYYWFLKFSGELLGAGFGDEGERARTCVSSCLPVSRLSRKFPPHA